MTGLVVMFPANVKKEQADQWREGFDDKHAGVGNTGKTKVVGAGAKVERLGMSQADAEFANSVELSVLDVSRIFRVPEWFLGVSQRTGKPVTPEHEAQRWLRSGLGPRLLRIESAFNADPDMFGGRDVAGFDAGQVVRGDLGTEDTIDHQRIQDGRLLVDEWRVEHGRDPYPDGLGSIPQIVPVGGAPNPAFPDPYGGGDDEDES